jgi:hypothetical protein
VREEAAKAKISVRKSAIPFWMWGAVAAALLFAFYNAYEVRITTNKVQEMRAALAQQIQIQRESAHDLALARREALILTDPKSVKIAMSAGNKDMPKLQATWHAELGLVVSGQMLPMPSGNRTMQLWLIPKTPGAKPVPSLTLRPDSNGKFDLVIANPPHSMDGTKALVITEEPEGGSPQPTTTTIWVGAVAGK